MAIDQSMLRLTAHQKLIYNISRHVRAIFMEIQENETKLVFRAYFCVEPTSHERDLISDAASETAIEFPDIGNVLVECIQSSQSFDELKKLDYWLFVRSEEIDGSA